MAVAVLFAESGAFFVAFLAIVALFLYAAAQRQPAPSGQFVGYTNDGRPIVVKSSAAKIPATIRVKVKDPWGNTTSYEDFARGAGEMANTFFGTLYRVVTGEHDEAGTEQDESARGG